MAIIVQNSAEGGTNSVTVTPANSGGASGNAWNSVSGTGAITYSTTTVARGTLGYRIEQAASATSTLSWNLSAVTEYYGRCYMYFTGFAGSTQVIIRSFKSDFVTECWRADLLSTGQVRLRDSATNILALTTQTLSPGVWYRLEWHTISGVANGTLDFTIYTADQTTPLYSYVNTACNTGSETSLVQFGPGFSTVTLPVMYTDELALDADDWLGVAAGTPLNSPPTANAGPDQNVSISTTVTLTGSGSSDTDGSIASYAWSQTGGTAVSLSSNTVAQPTFTAPGTASTLTFQLTVTDNNGATGTDTVTINVLASIVRQNSAEGGTDGVAVTTGNSGGASGTAWQTVNGGSAWTYASARTARGLLAYQCDQATSTAAVLQWQLATLAEHYGRIYFQFSAFATASDSIVRAWATGFSEAFRIEASSTQRLVVRDSSGTARFTSASSLVANSWYRLEWHAVSSTTVGQIEVRLYIADQTTPTETFSSTASLNLRAETSWVQFGPSFSLNPAAPRKWFDELVIGSSGGGWIGVAAGTPINQAPIANAGIDSSAEPGTVYGLQGSATDETDINLWSWRQISGTAVTLSSTTVQNPTFTVPKVMGGATLVFGLTVTDQGGLSSTEDTVTITALPPTLFFARSGSWSA